MREAATFERHREAAKRLGEHAGEHRGGRAVRRDVVHHRTRIVHALRPALAHTSPETLSFSDVTCLFNALTSIVLLIFSKRDRPASHNPPSSGFQAPACWPASSRWRSSRPVAPLPLLIALIGGGLFRHLPLRRGRMLAVGVRAPQRGRHHLERRVLRVGRIDHAVVHRAWTRRGWHAASSLLGIGAYTLTKTYAPAARISTRSGFVDPEGATPAHIIVGTFLFSYAFMVSLLSFAGLEHFSGVLGHRHPHFLLAGQRARTLSSGSPPCRCSTSPSPSS